jgi:hypothetical protein
MVVPFHVLNDFVMTHGPLDLFIELWRKINVLILPQKVRVYITTKLKKPSFVFRMLQSPVDGCIISTPYRRYSSVVFVMESRDEIVKWVPYDVHKLVHELWKDSDRFR